MKTKTISVIPAKSKKSNNKYRILSGRPNPPGAALLRNGINFSLFSKGAKAVSIVIYPDCDRDASFEFELDPDLNRTGYIWHAFITNLDPGVRYGFRIKREDLPEIERIILLDPYSRATCGGRVWGNPVKITRDNKKHTFRLSIIPEEDFDWKSERPLKTPLKDTIIYELHVRGFTRHSSSGVAAPGTFKGLTEKIPYLKELGITAVELMPVTDYDETAIDRIDPISGKPLFNFWGYDPFTFFALKSSYASNNENGAEVTEFKKMVEAFHKAGIEVLLDMVFNHTAEGNEIGPVYNFKGLEQNVYYMIEPKTNKFYNFSGCGNTVNCNHPIVRGMIIDSLRYWVTEMHVDGFRFDLASILGRGRDGEVLSNPPLIERIAEDPLLANTKLIAEAWDAAGLYQVGDFPAWQRWMEWNGKFRDDIRQYVKGDPGMVPKLATRVAGSSDLYQDDGREPFHSVNFVTCHDGFTLADLVSYNEKHNLANGENNRDGSDYNISWNCGVEGLTDSEDVNKLRRLQMKNFAAILLLSQGVPMITAGDEIGRSQSGNNNAYCQDNELNWINWELAEQNADLLRFFKTLIRFRKNHSSLRRSQFQVEMVDGVPEMSWHGFRTGQPDWSDDSRSLALHMTGDKSGPTPGMNDLYIIFNMDLEGHDFELPGLTKARKWYRVMDTSLDAPSDILEEGKETLLDSQSQYSAKSRSTVLLIGKSRAD